MKKLENLEIYYREQKREIFQEETEKMKKILKEKNISVKRLSMIMKINDNTLRNLLYNQTFSSKLLEKVKAKINEL
jgi:hypothetical protein